MDRINTTDNPWNGMDEEGSPWDGRADAYKILRRGVLLWLTLRCRCPLALALES